MHSFYTPAVGKKELANVAEVISEGTLSTGGVVERFESAVATLADRQYAVAVCSGSVALEFALTASGLEPGQRIIVSPFNCSAVVHSIRRAGLEPVFADIDPATYNVEPASVRTLLTETNEPIDGLLVTHSYGQPCQMDEIKDIAANTGLILVDDFCQAPGATQGGKPVGSFGAAGVCSFGATKNITTGEGGMVVTDDTDIAESVHEQRANDGVDTVNPVSNVKMNDVEAAIGLAQIERYDSILKTRRTLASVYRDQLHQQIRPQGTRPDTTHAYHRFAVRVDQPDSLSASLSDRQIQTALTIDKPLYDYQCVPPDAGPACPNAESLMSEGLLLPLHCGLTETDVREIATAVNEAV